MLFNLPNSTTEDSIRKLISSKGVFVNSIKISKSLDDTQISYVLVQFGDQKDAEKVKRSLYNVWLEDKKIRVLNQKDVENETYDNRTIVVMNIPSHYKDKKLLKHFRDFGAITSIELPINNRLIEDYLKNKQDNFTAESRNKAEIDRRSAEESIHRSLVENQEVYQDFLKEYFDPEMSTNLLKTYQPDLTPEKDLEQQTDILSRQRQVSSLNVITLLQSEIKEVGEGKDLIEKLRGLVDEVIPSLDNNTQNYDTVFESKRKRIEDVVSYLKQNKEALGDEAIESLLS